MLFEQLVNTITGDGSGDRYADYKAMKPVMAHLWPALFANPDAPLPFHVSRNDYIRSYVVRSTGIHPMSSDMQKRILRRVTNFLYIWTRRREYLESFEKHCTWYKLDGSVGDFIDFDYIEGRLNVLYNVRMRKDLDAAWNKLAGIEQFVIDTRVKL